MRNLKRIIAGILVIAGMQSLCIEDIKVNAIEKFNKTWEGYYVIPTSLVDTVQKDRYGDGFTGRKYRDYSEDDYKNRGKLKCTCNINTNTTYTYSISLDKNIDIDVKGMISDGISDSIPLFKVVAMDANSYGDLWNASRIKAIGKSDEGTIDLKKYLDYEYDYSDNSISIELNNYGLSYYELDTVTIEAGELFRYNNRYLSIEDGIFNLNSITFYEYNNKPSYYIYSFDGDGEIVSGEYSKTPMVVNTTSKIGKYTILDTVRNITFRSPYQLFSNWGNYDSCTGHTKYYLKDSNTLIIEYDYSDIGNKGYVNPLHVKNGMNVSNYIEFTENFKGNKEKLIEKLCPGGYDKVYMNNIASNIDDEQFIYFSPQNMLILPDNRSRDLTYVVAGYENLDEEYGSLFNNTFCTGKHDKEFPTFNKFESSKVKSPIDTSRDLFGDSRYLAEPILIKSKYIGNITSDSHGGCCPLLTSCIKDSTGEEYTTIDAGLLYNYDILNKLGKAEKFYYKADGERVEKEEMADFIVYSIKENFNTRFKCKIEIALSNVTDEIYIYVPGNRDEFDYFKVGLDR